MKSFLSLIFISAGFYSFAQEENQPNVYGIQPFMSIACIGGWESDCVEMREESFTRVADQIYNFYNSIGFNYQNGIKFEFDFDCDKIILKQRYIMAYASRVSETEGVVFCDTTLAEIKSKKNTWYSYTKLYPLMTDTAGYYMINDQTPPKGTYKLPVIHISDAKQAIAKDHKWLFETGTDQELRNKREVKLWPYAIELELTTMYKGKSTVWKFRFRIRHGEC